MCNSTSPVSGTPLSCRNAVSRTSGSVPRPARPARSSGHGNTAFGTRPSSPPPVPPRPAWIAARDTPSRPPTAVGRSARPRSRFATGTISRRGVDRLNGVIPAFLGDDPEQPSRHPPRLTRARLPPGNRLLARSQPLGQIRLAGFKPTAQRLHPLSIPSAINILSDHAGRLAPYTKSCKTSSPIVP